MERTSRPHRTDEVDRNRSKNCLFNETVSNSNHRVNNRLMDKKSMDRRNYQMESTEDEEDDDDTLSNCTSDKLGLCATCNLVIVESNDGSCTQKPLVCHRCIKRLDNRSNPPFEYENNCTMCRSDSQQSLSNYSQDSVDYVNQPKRSARTYSLSQTSMKSDAQHMGGGYFIQASPGDRRFPMFSRSSSIYAWNQPQTEIRHRTNHQTSCYNMTHKESSIASNSSEMKVNYQTLECSRRPIRCPKLDCSMNVAFSALTHHFLFDHPEVPVISVDPEMKSTVVFRSSSIACDSSRCLALLLVSDKLPEGAARLFNGSQIHAKYRNRLPLPVLAARLRRRSLFTSTNEMDSGDAIGDGEVIIIWITGLDVGGNAGTLRCSIQAMDSIENECIRSLTYTGPINSLRTAQCPRQVLQNGDCLVLHEGFVKNVSSDHTSLNVNFVVH